MADPTSMQAAVLDGPKLPFKVASIARPKPAPGEVLVRIKASGVNPLDTRSGPARPRTRVTPPAASATSPSNSRPPSVRRCSRPARSMIYIKELGAVPIDYNKIKEAPRLVASAAPRPPPVHPHKPQ